MGRLILVPGVPVDLENPYRARFASYTVTQLVEAFNGDQSKQGFVAARGKFLIALREAFLACGMDCTSFITPEGMDMNFPVEIDGPRIVQRPPTDLTAESR